jgi:hypothetical protein
MVHEKLVAVTINLDLPAAEQFQNVAFGLGITNLLGLQGVLPNLEL